jgi:hypothetical protein
MKLIIPIDDKADETVFCDKLFHPLFYHIRHEAAKWIISEYAG